MKIALVSRYFNKHQGIPRVVAELAERFSREHEVHVYSQTMEDVDDRNFTFHRVPSILPDSFLNELFFFFLSGLMVAKQRFDVVNCHDPCFHGRGIFTSHAFPRAGIGTIGELNGRADTGIPSGFFLPFRLLFPVSEYNMRSGRAGRIIAVSGMIKMKIAGLLGRPEEDMDVVPNGMDPSVFNRESAEKHSLKIRSRFGIRKDDFLLLFVGYYHLRKGLQFLVKALARIDDQRIKLMIVGSDPFRRDYILSLIREHGLTERIIFAGDRNDVQEFYAAADALALPALYEPFGNVVLEAMGCGIPVIVSECAGASEVIRDGKNGLLVRDPSDPVEIADKILYLYDNPLKADEIAREGYETAAGYTWDAIAARTMAVYERYLEHAD